MLSHTSSMRRVMNPKIDQHDTREQGSVGTKWCRSFNVKERAKFPQTQTADNVFNTFQVPMGCQGRREKQKQSVTIKNWRKQLANRSSNIGHSQRLQGQISKYMPLKFQNMWSGHLGRVRAVKPQIALPSASERSIHPAPIPCRLPT